VIIPRSLIMSTRPLRYGIDGVMFRTFADTAALRQQKDRFAGSPMLVVGNGPSLNKTPLEEFAGVPSVGMNKIDLMYSRTRWRPSVVVCLNNIVVKQHQDHFAASEIPVFVGWKARHLVSRHNRDRLNYFNTLLSNRFSTDAVTGFGSSATVTYIALQMAYWMGADPVILFGVDHSFNYSGSHATYQKRKGSDVNHFDPNYFKEGTIWATPDLDQSELDYALARQAYEADGRRILDATIEGKLEVFPKISVDQALEIVGKGGPG